jgi:hypothetical protein
VGLLGSDVDQIADNRQKIDRLRTSVERDGAFRSDLLIG